MSYARNKKSATSYHGLFHLTLDQSKLIDRLLVGSSALCTLSRFDASPLHVMLASGTKKIEYFYWFSLFYCSVPYYTTTALYCNFAGFVRSVQKKKRSTKVTNVIQYINTVSEMSVITLYDSKVPNWSSSPESLPENHHQKKSQEKKIDGANALNIEKRR